MRHDNPKDGAGVWQGRSRTAAELTDSVPAPQPLRCGGDGFGNTLHRPARTPSVCFAPWVLSARRGVVVRGGGGDLSADSGHDWGSGAAEGAAGDHDWTHADFAGAVGA